MIYILDHLEVHSIVEVLQLITILHQNNWQQVLLFKVDNIVSVIRRRAISV